MSRSLWSSRLGRLKGSRSDLKVVIHHGRMLDVSIEGRVSGGTGGQALANQSVDLVSHVDSTPSCAPISGVS